LCLKVVVLAYLPLYEYEVTSIMLVEYIPLKALWLVLAGVFDQFAKIFF